MSLITQFICCNGLNFRQKCYQTIDAHGLTAGVEMEYTFNYTGYGLEWRVNGELMTPPIPWSWTKAGTNAELQQLSKIFADATVNYVGAFNVNKGRKSLAFSGRILFGGVTH